jgi:hypothetical protein
MVEDDPPFVKPDNCEEGGVDVVDGRSGHGREGRIRIS